MYTVFFISNTFISNARLKLTKNQAKAKQHPEAELLLFENYLLSSSSLSFKNNKRYSKKCTKKQVRLFKWGYIINGNEKRLKTKNRWYRYDMNRSRIRHGYKSTKYQIYFSIMMVMYIKQYLSNIWTSIHEKVKQHWGWVEKKQKQPPEVFCKISHGSVNSVVNSVNSVILKFPADNL